MCFFKRLHVSSKPLEGVGSIDTLLAGDFYFFLFMRVCAGGSQLDGVGRE